jgi:hypothetical protein
MGVRWEFGPRSELENEQRRETAGLGLSGKENTWIGVGDEDGGSKMR